MNTGEEGQNDEVFDIMKLGNNFSKLAVMKTSGESTKKANKELPGSWLDHFSLISEEDMDNEMIKKWKEEHPNGVFFRDDGSGSYLTENMLYEH